MMVKAHSNRLLTVAALVVAGLAGTACADEVSAPNELASGEPTAFAAAAGGMGGQMQLREGALYVAHLRPLNARVQQQLDPDMQTPHGVASGTAYFRVVNGMLHATVDVMGAEPVDGEPFPEGLHAQHIHEADQCPTASADVNGDGIVDVIEGVPFYGPIMVPLDGDISNTTSEIPTFPLATGDRGTYHYEAGASLETLIAALGHPLDLPSRHVVVHGVDLDTPLPASVQSLGGLPSQITLPIACGEIREMR